jgi:hypothetical protein
MAGFIFGGDTGVSYAELQRRRAIAEQRAKQARGFPKTIGEGIYSLGTDIGEMLSERNLTEAERQYARGQEAAAAPFSAATTTAPPMAGATTPPPVSVSSYAPQGLPQPRDQIATALLNQGRRPEEVAEENPTIGADTSAPQGSDSWTARENAIAGLESSGRYNALGPVTRTGDRAYGKYQVMGANIPTWTEAALGQRLTPQQFLASKQAQDAVFRHRFGQYVNQYGEEGAARAWFGGEGNIDKPQVRDQLGTSVGNYGRNYVNRLGGGATRGGGALALAAPGVASDAPSVLPRVPRGTDEAPEPTPTDIQPSPLSGRTQIAQAPAASAVPGQAPAARGVQAVQADAGEYIRPRPVPPTPPQPTPMEPREIAARQALQSRYAADPDFRRRAELARDEEAAKRKFIDDRNIEAYKADAQRFPQDEAKYHDDLRDARKRRLENIEKAQKIEADRRAETEKEATRATYGNVPSFVMDDLKDRKTKAATAVGSIEGINNAKLAMEAGTVFGVTAPAQLLYYRARATAGDQNAQRIVTATETFKNNLGPIAAAAIKAYGGPQISNEDRRFGLQMSGADITQDEASARRLLDIAERSAQAQLKDHRQYLDTALKNQPPVLRQMFDVPDPLPGIPVPAAGPKAVVDVASEAEAQKLPSGTRFRLNGRTGTVK